LYVLGGSPASSLAKTSGKLINHNDVNFHTLDGLRSTIIVKPVHIGIIYFIYKIEKFALLYYFF